MNRPVWRVLALLIGAVFVFAVVTVAVTRLQYRRMRDDTVSASERFTAQQPTGGPIEAEPALTEAPTALSVTAEPTAIPATREPSPGPESTPSPEPTRAPEYAPIRVDFEALQAINPDVAGWIYCPDTPIDFAVCHGADNAYYLNHAYDGASSRGGAIFVECKNRKGFVDANTIIYGHHVLDGSMFACLENWREQAYYDEHPVMYLLTPEQDYRIVLLAGYTISAYADTYTVLYNRGVELEQYLDRHLPLSDFTAKSGPDSNANYVLLSTCAYEFQRARYVLHGMLEPLDRP